MKPYKSAKRFFSLILVLTCWVSAAAQAQDYRPPVAKFDGKGGVSFPSDVSLEFSRYATIEFWVAATWSQIDYDPFILSYLGPQGPRYGIVISGDKQRIGMVSGEMGAAIPYDFSDGKLHHVAFIVIDDETSIIIDNEFVGSLAMGIQDLPTTNFVIGSINGRDFAFPGALAGLKLWNAPLDPDDIERFKFVDLNGPDGKRHPFIDTLVGLADFSDGKTRFLLTGEPLNITDEPQIEEDDDFIINADLQAQ